MYINNLGHMTKMAAMPIYGKNPSNIFFSETNRLILMKLGVMHPWLKYYNVYINHDPVMTLTKFMARSTLVVKRLIAMHRKPSCLLLIRFTIQARSVSVQFGNWQSDVF